MNSESKLSNPDPLHGITLEKLLTELVAHYGFTELAAIVPIKCFSIDPSIASSLKFLRKTPWARAKVEKLYLDLRWELDYVKNMFPISKIIKE